MLTNAPAATVGAFSIARAVVAGAWTGCAFALAQLAEGLAVDPVLTALFIGLVSSIAGRLQTVIGFGLFLMSTVSFAAVLVASIGFGTSLDQFFPDVWGPIDFMIVLLLWFSPLMAVLVSRCERKVQQWMILILDHLLTSIPRVHIPVARTVRVSHEVFDLRISANELSRSHPRRGPPSLVVA